VSQKSGKPFAVGHVGLSTGQMLGVAGIDENYPNRSFQDIEDRAPVDSGTLDGDCRTLVIEQPIFQGLQITGESTKLTLFNTLAGRRLRNQTCSHRFFMNVQTTANRVQYLHYFGIFFSSHGNLPFDWFLFFEDAMVFF
jgi:hypothetical protein